MKNLKSIFAMLVLLTTAAFGSAWADTEAADTTTTTEANAPYAESPRGYATKD